VCLLALWGCGNTVSVPTSPPAPEELLVGKWQASPGEGMEFTRDGGLSVVQGDRPPLMGKYRHLEAGVILIDLRPAVAEPFKAGISVTRDDLTVTRQTTAEDRFGSKEAGERKSAWKRVENFDPGAAPDEKALAGLPGHWKSATDEEAYDFFADGTFARFHKDDILDSVHMGSWKARPAPGGYLDCSYPDSGRTEAVAVRLGAGSMVLGRDDPKCPIALLRDAKAYQRTGDPAAEMKPTGPDGVLSAYQLYQEYKADPKAGDARYKGKEIEVAGVVQSVMSGSSSVVIVVNGKSESRDDTVTKIALATGEKEGVVCWFAGVQVHPTDDKEETPLKRGKFVRIKGKCLGMGKDNKGMFQLGGDLTPVRFEACQVVAK
jgi:hypothetical protein